MTANQAPAAESTPATATLLVRPAERRWLDADGPFLRRRRIGVGITAAVSGALSLALSVGLLVGGVDELRRLLWPLALVGFATSIAAACAQLPTPRLAIPLTGLPTHRRRPVRRAVHRDDPRMLEDGEQEAAWGYAALLTRIGPLQIVQQVGLGVGIAANSVNLGLGSAALLGPILAALMMLTVAVVAPVLAVRIRGARRFLARV